MQGGKDVFVREVIATVPKSYPRPALKLWTKAWKIGDPSGYAPGYEIQEYYEKIAKSYNLDKVTEFYAEIKLCTWDESQMLWVVETRNLQTGAKKVWTCNLVWPLNL
jgi:cation diffusion facilitator CzcD-associated flavoprotein CzcO